MGFIFKDADEKPEDPKAARLRAIWLSLPLVLIAIAAVVLLVHDGLLVGGLSRKKAMGLLSAAIVCGGLIALIFAITAKKQAIDASLLHTPDDQPWLGRKEWAGGRIVTSTRKSIVLLWIFVAFWCLVSAMITLGVVPYLLQLGHHYIALAAMAFPVIGLAILYFAVNTTQAWSKFNRSVFQMATVPAAAGGTLAGEIQVPMKLRPQHGLQLRLACVRRTTTGKSNNRQVNDKTLWQDEKWLRADLPPAGSNATRIPVFFKLPAELPAAEALAGDGIHWKLEAYAKLRGPDFQAAFDVPVFKLPEMPPAADDPTTPYQMSLDEIQRQIHSLVQVKDLADGGKEFIFPAGRNPGFASGATIVCLIWTGIIGMLLLQRAPAPLVLALSAIDLLMTGFVLDLWFRRSRVAVTAKGLTVERAWFGFKNEHRFPAGEIREIASDIGATAGHAAYHDLKVQTRDGKEFVLAKSLNNKPEADWLVRQMLAALKSPPTEVSPA